uniref:Uncharacterized protein n=1 Tax=Arundo donax TaxID=35708 RepID=A0A0A9GDM9_ARUDO
MSTSCAPGSSSSRW